MKYQQRYELEIVDEWRKCYLNYSQLDFYLEVMGSCTKQKIYLNQQSKIQQLRSKPQQTNKSQQQSKQDIKKQPQKSQQSITENHHPTTIQKIIGDGEISSQKQQLILQRRKEFSEMSAKANNLFLDAFDKNLGLYQQFVEFKYAEINRNFHVSKGIYYMSRQKELQPSQLEFQHYLQYLFIESKFLASMVRSNIEAQSRLIQKHNLYSLGIFESPKPYLLKTLSIQKCNLLKCEIQAFYVESHKKTMNQSRERIRCLATFIEYDRHAESLFIGILSGVLMSVIIFMCIVLARHKIVLEIDPIFNQHFPLWRGISFYIFHTWMLGINLFYLQRYKISHQIILDYQYIQHPRSNDIFKIATFFSLLFIILFVIYALQITEIIQTLYFAPQWLPLFVWAIFFLFMINPLPIIFSKGRLYIWKMLSKTFSSIWTYPLDFLTFVAIAQLFALINAFQDTVYTICYYSTLQLPLPLVKTLESDQCRTPGIIAKFAFTLFLQSLRAFHSARALYYTWGTNVFYKLPDFQNLWKFLFGIATAILSFFWTVANTAEILPVWILFAIITTLISIVLDLWISFDVCKGKSKNAFLRDEIIFPQFNYYMWIIATFLLRCSWTLYISPNIVRNFLGSPEIFLLTFGYLQIIRRGIWNVIVIQLEQVRNREVFRAVPKQKQKIQDQIYKAFEQVSNNRQSTAQILASGLIEESELENVVSENTRKLRNLDDKKKIVQLAKDHFDQQLSNMNLVKEYMKDIQDKVQELIKNVYN